MEPIRVLHMIGSLEIGGSQAMIMNIYRNIDRQKIQFDFVIDKNRGGFFEREITELGGKIYKMPSFRGINIHEIRRAWDEFFVEHPEYKIFHSHVRSYASLYIPIAKNHGLKTIIHSHSTSNGSGISAIVKAVMQYPLRYQADYFFGCSQKSGEWLFGKKIVSGDRFYILKNAINTTEYRANDDIRNQYRKRLGIDNDVIVYVHVGRLHEAKNHMFLLDVFCNIVKKNPNSVLLLVGDGELRNQIEQKIKEMKLRRNVVIMGARNDVANILKTADCFLFPSNWEGLPVTVVEAQAAGLPCLISDRITDEVNITSLVKKLPIDQGVKCWIDAIEKTSFQKQDVIRQICKAGFDIKESSEWIQNFYKEIYV